MCVQSHIPVFQVQVEPVLGPHNNLKVLLRGAVRVKGQLKLTQNAAQDGLHLTDGKLLPNAVAKGNRERGQERGGREEFILYWSSNYVEDIKIVSLMMALLLKDCT